MSTVWNALTYDLERLRLVPCFDEFYGTAAELIARCRPSNPSVLDLGAGTGILSAAIVDRVAIGWLTLLDASAKMLERAATRLARCHPEIVVQPLTAELPSGPYEAVVSALAIHHLSDVDSYIKIYWNANLDMTTCGYNPPPGYDYRWSGD